MSNPVPVLVATGQPLGELELERQKNSQLVAKVQDLEATVRQQKQQLASMVDPVSLLVGQFDQVLQHSTHQVFHGPDTVEHFNAFSVDEVIRELKSDAPDFYQLFQSLGNTQREKKQSRGIFLGGIEGTDVNMHPSECSVSKTEGTAATYEHYALARSTSKQVHVL